MKQGDVQLVLQRDAQWNSVSGCYGVHRKPGRDWVRPCCRFRQVVRLGSMFMNDYAGGVLEELEKGWVGPCWRGYALGSVGVPLYWGSRMVSGLLCPPCVEVENSSLVLRQFWWLTEVHHDLDTNTLSGSESGSCLYLKDFLPYLLISLSNQFSTDEVVCVLNKIVIIQIFG